MQHQQQHERTTTTKAKPQQCQDAEGCPAPADFTYVWPDSGTQYAGCTRHAYKAAAVVGNMGRVLELVPIDGGPPVKLGDSLGGVPAPAGAPAPSSAELAALTERVEAVERHSADNRLKIEELERAGMARTLTDKDPPTKPEKK